MKTEHEIREKIKSLEQAHYRLYKELTEEQQKDPFMQRIIWENHGMQSALNWVLNEFVLDKIEE